MGKKIYDRETAEYYDEKQFKALQLKFLYQTVFGRIILKLFITRKLYSRLNARHNDKLTSVKKIGPFIEEYSIDMSEYEDKKYKSFNEFFIRKLKSGKRQIDKDKNSLVAVADSKLLYYKIGQDLSLKIKNSVYTVEELLQDKKLAADYRNGVCLVFRLTVDDYHHYCFCDDGMFISSKTINGRLHTVGSISSKRHKVFCENYREYSLLKTVNFGDMIQIEVGALLVGKIVNVEKNHFVKGEEKGYFEMGGSALVLLFKENTVVIDEDIISHSCKGIETKIKLGGKIGKKYA